MKEQRLCQQKASVFVVFECYESGKLAAFPTVSEKVFATKRGVAQGEFESYRHGLGPGSVMKYCDPVATAPGSNPWFTLSFCAEPKKRALVGH